MGAAVGELVNKLVDQGLDKFIDKSLEKLGTLADLARDLGGDYVIAALGLWFLYRSLNQHLPMIITAWSADRKDRRQHERKVQQIRQSMSSRSKKNSKKDTDNAA